MCKAVKLTALAFVFFLTFIYDALSLKIIPERAAIIFLNETYLINNASLNVRRMSRGGEYAANLEVMIKVPLGNNVTVDLIFYEYLHNEYRRSFVELHYTLCDLVQNDIYLGYIIRNAGWVTCPMPAGFKISMKNVTFNVKIPSVWPFEKGKGEITATDNTNGAMIGKGHVVLTFKQN